MSSYWLLLTVYSIHLVLLFASSQRTLVEVTVEDVVQILSSLHPQWPEKSIAPLSDIRGLTLDTCNGSFDCKAPRACINCPQPPCLCAKAPSHPQFVCNSSADCEDGEFCGWEPLFGFTSGFCASSNNFQAHLPFPILHTPLKDIPRFDGVGLTGDRCFSHSECHGARSCLGKNSVPNSYQIITTCESSKDSCVCTPVEFSSCSLQSSCENNDEICALVQFNLSHTISLAPSDLEQEAILPGLCISSILGDNQRVNRVDETHSEEHFNPINSQSSTAIILNSPPEDPSLLQLIEPRSPIDRPFSIPSGSRFNSFSTDELTNDFISGIMSLVILAQLHRLVRGLINASSAIRHHGYSSYIIYSRLASFRHIHRLLSCQEPLPGAARKTKIVIQDMNWKIVLFPFLALIGLYGTEFATIVAGTQTTSRFDTKENFDPVISVVGETPRPRVQDGRRTDCDDFFLAESNLHQSGKVFKCVHENLDWSRNKYRNLIQFRIFYGSGETGFRIYSREGRSSELLLSTGIRTVSGQTLRTMPFRPELMNEQARKKLLNGILNTLRKRLGQPALDTNLTLWYSTEQRDGDGIVQMIFGHRHSWDESVENLTEIARQELRNLDLVLNSTGAPWVYTGPHSFIQVKNATVAVRREYRVSQGWLVIAAVVVSVLYLTVNSYVWHFDDVAYSVMRELIGDDCILGPLAEDSGVSSREVDLRSNL
ncbi:hypothetical protein FGB62_99g117 [Gracilaria domingensis]|nr:hypothetical protein FGB62_99g117 [Gracilaria domingensis]